MTYAATADAATSPSPDDESDPAKILALKFQGLEKKFQQRHAACDEKLKSAGEALRRTTFRPAVTPAELEEGE